MKIKHFIRRNGAAVVCCIAALCCGFGLGLLLTPSEKAPPEISASEEPLAEHMSEQPAENVIKTGDSAILPTTDVVWIDYYLKCGHEYVNSKTDNIIGMTGPELENKYPDYAVTQMSLESVRLVREIDGYCPSHYLLKIGGDDSLLVMRTDPETLTLKQEKEFSIDLDALGAGVQEQLKEGIVFDTMDEINAFIEDAES
jgi:hypothetical protein